MRNLKNVIFEDLKAHLFIEYFYGTGKAFINEQLVEGSPISGDIYNILFIIKMQIGTYIYSSHSIETLKEMLNEFFLVFNIPTVTPDDLFYYAVLCKDITYANYKYWNEAPVTLEIPEVFTSPCSTQEGRLEYVHFITNQIVRGEIKKPEWMLYIEMTENCNNYEAAPSNYLYLEAKEGKYEKLATKILDFLYSPNMMNYTNRYYN